MSLNKKISNEDLSRTYYFLHIPKTGGTSLTAIFDRFFPIDNIFPAQLWWDVGNVKLVREKNYQFIRGHFGTGAKILSKKELQTFTMLRDPLSLIHSTYQYIKRESNTKTHDFVIENKLTFEEFLDHDRTKNLVSNRLVKGLLLASGAEFNVDDLAITPENFTKHRRQWNKNKKQLNKQQLLVMAKQYIASLFWFGLTEHFDASIRLLCYQMSWPPIGETPKLNSHNKPPIISNKAVALVNKLNSLDKAVYEYAEIIFKQRLNQFHQDIGAVGCDAIEVEKKIDLNYQQNYLTVNGLKLHHELDYDFSMVLLGQNWHQREWNQEQSCYFRWTGPDDITTIDFWLVPNNFQITVVLLDSISLKLFDDLKININNHTVTWEFQKNNNYNQITFKIDAKLVKENGLLRLSFVSKCNEIHDSKYHSNDKRRVGFAVKHIMFSEI